MISRGFDPKLQWVLLSEFHIRSFELNAADAPTTKKMQIETETQRKNRIQKARLV